MAISEEDAFGSKSIPEEQAFGNTGISEEDAFGSPKTTAFEDVRVGVGNVVNNAIRSSAEFQGSGLGQTLLNMSPMYHAYKAITGDDAKFDENRIVQAQESVDKGLMIEDAKKKDPGVGGSIIQGLTGVAGTTAAFMANPAVGMSMAATQAYGAARNVTEGLKRQGVSEEAANKVGWAMGLTEAITQVIPGYGGAVGKTLAAKAVPALVGGGINTVQGAVSNSYAYKVLSAEGHGDIAEAFNPYDPKNWATDLVTGAAPIGIKNAYRAGKDAAIVKNITPKLDSIKQDLVEFSKWRTQNQQKADLKGGQTFEQTPLLRQSGEDLGTEVNVRNPKREPLGPNPADDDLSSQMNLLTDDPISKLMDYQQQNPKKASAAQKAIDASLQQMRQEHQDKVDLAQSREGKKGFKGIPYQYDDVVKGGRETESFSRWLPITSLAEADAANSHDISGGKWHTAKGLVANLRNNLSSGIQGLAQNTNNPYLKYAFNVINKADEAANRFVSRTVHPLAQKYQKMSDQEKVEVIRALQLGDQFEAEVLPQMLQKAGISEAGQDFIKSYYDTNKSFLNMHNQNLIAEGKDPIEARRGHVPSRWNGEYVTYGINKKTGKLETVIIEPTFYQSLTAQRYLKKMNPDIQFTEISGKDARNMRPDTLRIGLKKMAAMSKTLPKDHSLRVMLDKASAVLEAGNVESARKMYSFDQHELFKLGVDGHLGKKKWLDEVQNANDMFKSMVEYWEQGAVSSHYMKVGKEIQRTANHIADTQPNTAELLNDIYSHNIMQRPNEFGDSLNTILKAPGLLTGLGADAVNRGSARVGNAMQMMTLGMYNARFTAVQLLSIFQQGLSNLLMASNAVKQNPGILAQESIMGTMKNALYITNKKAAMKLMDAGELQAMKFAEDRGMLNFSEFEYVRSFGESATKRRLTNLGNMTLSATDKVTRPAVFLSAFNILRKAGYPQELAQETAANITQSAMVDYRQNMRAMIYTKGGTVGREASRLRTFLHGYVSNASAMYKTDKKAFALHMAMLGLLAGSLGFPGVEFADDVYQEMFGKSMFENIKDENIRDFVEFGALSAGTGLWFQPSFSMSQVFPDRTQSIVDYMFPYHSKAANMFLKSGEFVLDPNTRSAGNAAIEVAPLSVRGAVVEQFKRDEQGYRHGAKGDKQYPMTDREWNWYRFGISTTELGKFQHRKWNFEQKKRDQEKELADVGRKIVDAYVTKEYVPKEIEEDFQKYADEKGPEAVNRLIGAVQRQLRDLNMTTEEQLNRSGTYQALKELMARQRARVLASQREKAPQ